MLLCLAQNILVQHLNHATTYLSSACQHHAEITQSRTFAALIRLSTTTHNLLMFNTSEISSNIINIKNSAYWQIDTSWLLSYTRFIQVPGRTVTRLDPDQSSPTILLSSNSFDSWKLVPDDKALVVTLEKRAISYLSVSGRIRVIDPYVLLGFFLITI